MKKVNVGIVGCGNICDIYLKNLTKLFKNVEVVSLSNRTMSKAIAKAKEYGIAKVQTFEEMITDDSIQLIINLTTPKAHYELNKKALNSLKHVYCEKPLSLSFGESKELLDIAKKNGVLIGSAPDTFLGASYRTARRLIDEGQIGTITSAYSFDVCHGHENWHPSPSFFYEVGGGPMYDRGPYNLSVLIDLIGPADYVAGMTGKAFKNRVVTSEPLKGSTVPVKIPTHVNALVHFANGALCTMSTSFDVWESKLPFTEIHGTKGSLLLPIPIDFGGDVFIKKEGSDSFEKVDTGTLYQENSRGLGVSDMARCILDGGSFRCDASTAVHAIEIMEKIHQSSHEKTFKMLESTCNRPEPLQEGLKPGEVGK